MLDFGGLRKIPITTKQSNLASWVLRRSKENNFLYRSVSLEVQIEIKLVLRKNAQMSGKSSSCWSTAWSVKMEEIMWSAPLLLRMVKIAGLYLVSIKSYAKNGGWQFLKNPTIVWCRFLLFSMNFFILMKKNVMKRVRKLIRTHISY